MQNLDGKIAFVTGAASGIGFELARACGSAGMGVMLADIDDDGLRAAEAKLAEAGLDVGTVHCDITDIQSVQSAAEATIQRFGKLHLLANNAGVLIEGGAGETSIDKWRWAIAVNFTSVVYGVETFLPLIRAHGEGGHILNTASVAGLVGFSGLAAYVATKHAVFGYTESIAAQLQDEGIGVSVLCPGMVNTRIAEVARYDDSDEETEDSGFAEAVSQAMSPEVVARYTLEQIQEDAVHIFTHPGTRDEILERYGNLKNALDVTAASEIINSDPDSKRQARKEIIEDLAK